MESVIRKCGNSPALRLNVATMKAATFDLEQRVTVKATKGRIVIESFEKLEYKLADSVAAITSENRHGEQSFGYSLTVIQVLSVPDTNRLVTARHSC